MADLKYEKFRAGDTFKLNFDLETYPAADDWDLTYYLKGGQSYSVAGAVANGEYTIEAAAATTQNWAAGDYGAFIQVSKAGEKHTIELGQVTILAALSTLTNYDGRSHVKKVLDALEALIEGKTSSDVQSYSISGRQLTKMSPEDLLSWRNKYKEFYRQELSKVKIFQGKRAGNTTVVRF